MLSRCFRAVALCIVVLAADQAARGELIVNGGFEQPNASAGIGLEVNAGDDSIPGWTIVSGSVDVHNSGFYPAFEGGQTLDLDGLTKGSVRQSFSTVVGATYTLSFWFSNNARGGTSPASAKVSLSGLGTDDLLDRTITHGGATTVNMDYEMFMDLFVANSLTTTLQFTSLDPAGSYGGVVIDAVSVNLRAIPEPTAMSMAGIALLSIFALRSLSTRGAWRTGMI